MSPTPFTPDVARRLAGPAWLVERRTAAAERFAAATLPTTESEVWRYSRIAELDLDRFAPVADGDPAAAGAPAAPTWATAARVVVVDGVVVDVELDPAVAAMGVYVGRLHEHERGEALLGSVVGAPADVFGELNDAFAREPLAVVVPDGVVVDRPVLVQHLGVRADAAVFPRLVVHVGRDASVTVVDEQRSGEAVSLVVPVVELRAERAARLSYCNVQALGAAGWQLGSTVASIDADATLHASNASLGGDYARTRTDCRLDGAGASGELSSLYFASGDQMLDFRTFQEHAAPHTTSNLLFKGVVDDRAQSVYTGLIKVQKQARGTNAFQTNRNLKLSAEARAESVPNLEIENNDVRCSHASTVGPIDEDQRFYLESRGVPPEAAERLVVGGFFAEVLEKLPVPEVAADVRRAIGTKLDAHVGSQAGGA